MSPTSPRASVSDGDFVSRGASARARTHRLGLLVRLVFVFRRRMSRHGRYAVGAELGGQLTAVTRSGRRCDGSPHYCDPVTAGRRDVIRDGVYGSTRFIA